MKSPWETRSLTGAVVVDVDDEDLRITHAPGDPDRHVVSFTGVGGGIAGVQAEEFRKSIENGPLRTATYVIDKGRSWFNAVHAEVARRLGRLTARSGRVVTVGNSMGGFGALHFAGAIPNCTRAIAFAPQFSVRPSLMPPGETRWAAHRAAIREHVLGHALHRASPEVDYLIFAGAEEPLDVEHARRLAEEGTRRTHVFLLRQSGHDTAAAIKEAGALRPLLDLLLEDAEIRPRMVLDLLRDHGLAVRRLREALVPA